MTSHSHDPPRGRLPPSRWPPSLRRARPGRRPDPEVEAIKTAMGQNAAAQRNYTWVADHPDWPTRAR